MKKTLVTLLLTLVMVLGICLSITPNAQAATVNGTAIELLYDDRKDLADLLGVTVESVTISDENVTSKDVDGTADEAVLTYDEETGTLYAVGTGTATLTVNGTAYTVTVSPAPISVFLITGHSVGYGQYGNAKQSVAIEPGQAYSSWWRDSLTSAEGGIGYGANVRAGGANEYSIDAFAQGQNGTIGAGSALAYKWNELTGEKVWVMNLAVPGSCINEWLPGVTGWHYDKNGTTKYMYKYESVQEHFGYLQTILSNEIAAGHYTLSHMSMFYFSGANFGNANYNDWTYESLKSDYHTFWEGLKEDMAMDIDGDGTTETFESLGIIPLWTASNQDYRQDKLLNYYMAASADYPDVYIASDVYKGWAAGALDSFPAIDYTTQGTAVAVPTSVAHSDQGGTSSDSVFCSNDSTHLSQVTYNAVGLDMAVNANSWYTNTDSTTEVELQYLDASAVPETIQVNHGMTSSVMVPVVKAGTRGNVTVETTGNVAVNWPMYIEGTAVGTGTVSVAVDGTTVDSVAVEVLDKHEHCVCGGHASGMTDHTCETVGYQAWGNTDAEKTSLPSEAGNYYLVSDITLSATWTNTASTEVNLCLNGHNITSTKRVVNVRGTLSVTDCGSEADWGTISTTVAQNYGGIFYIYENAELNLYGGIFDASSAAINQGSLAVVGNSSAATMNIYGGKLIGGAVTAGTTSAGKAVEARGGALYMIASSTVNMYGGTITGGSSAANGGNVYIVSGSTFNLKGGTVTGGSSTKTGGNIFNDGKLNISGGTVSSGTATTNGGNIAVEDGGVLTISGGTVTSGVATGHGGNIQLNAGGTINMTGGTVTAGKAVSSTGKQGGNINISNAGTLNVSGGTVSDGVAGGYGGNICGTPGSKINISGTAVISGGATGTDGAGTSGSGGNIFGGGGTSLSNITISGGTISGGKALAGGNVYVDGKATISGGTIKDGTVPTANTKAMGGNICTGSRSATTLTITGGTITGGVGYYGGSIASKVDTTISGGTISGGRAYYRGGNIYQIGDADCTLTVTGTAVIKGGVAKATDTGTNSTDYTANNFGGNIYIDGANDEEVGHAVISGGTISGGYANCGGNIFANGTMLISGGTISGGYARGNNACGGNLYLGMIRSTTTGEIYCSVTMTGGTIEDGYADGTGGNAQIHGHFLMTGGEFLNGSAQGGGNIRIFRPGNFVLDGGTITGGTCRNIGSTNCGNTIQLAGYTATTSYSQVATLTVKSGTITGTVNERGVNGGTIGMLNFSVLNVEGGTINGGKVINRVWDGVNYYGRGGTIYVNAATAGRTVDINISGGVINGGQAGTYGGLISVRECSGTVNINITGGTLNGGTAEYGGILSTEDDCTVNITGGTFAGGSATNGGLFWLSGGANVTISGGVLDGGSASGSGDGIYVENATLTIKDDAQLNGAGTNLYVNNTTANAAVTLENLTDRLIVVDAADKTAAYAASAADCSVGLPCADSGYKTVWADGSLSFAENSAGAVAAVYEGTDLIAQFPTFDSAAYAAMNSTGYVKLLADTESSCTVDGTLWVDMAGFDLTGITVTGNLYGMDSSTDSYTDENVGILTCTVSGEGQVVSNNKTTTQLYGSVKRYMAVPGENGTYSFHRFYLGITKVTLKPATVGVGYKAVFAGSDSVKNYMTGYGYTMWIYEDNKVVNTRGADKFVSLDELTLRIDNFLTPGADEQNAINAELDIHGSVFMKLPTGEIIESVECVYSFRDVMEMVASSYNDFTEAQQQAVIGLHSVYHDLMITWDIPDVHHGEGSDWVAVDTAGFEALLETTYDSEGNETSRKQFKEDVKIYLTEDVSLTTSINIMGGQNITICLNGHNLHNSTRMFNVYGTLNIYDCCDGGSQPGTVTSNYTSYGPVMYTYRGSVVNLYGGELVGTKTVTGGGVVVLGNDTSSYSTATADTVLNMYGGKIYGGSATGSGGNIVTYHGGTLNMYGGEIFDGNAGGNGGNISAASGINDTNLFYVNIYGGKIYGGVAGGNGGNIQTTGKTELHIYGGEISDGLATGNGGNIYTNSPAVTVCNSTVSGGNAEDGGNIYIVPDSSSAVVTMENATVTGGEATRDGGNLAVLNKGTYTMTNMTVTNGIAGNDGGNIYLFRDMNEANTSLDFPTLTVNDSTITGGEAGDKGSGIYVQEGILTLTGSTQVTGNTGSNLYLDAGQTVELSELAGTAKIGISMNIAGTITDDVAYIGNLSADDETMAVENVGGVLKLTGGLSANVPALTGYSVGWYRGDITPTEPMPLDGMGNNAGRMDKWAIKTNLEAGFTVIADETGIENAIILVSVDTLFIQKELSGNLCAAISDATGIPENRIFLSASHTHCGVDHDALYEQTREYLEDFYSSMTQYAVLAVEDLKPATIQVGSIDLISEEGNSLNLSRRYIGDDGNAYSSVDSASYPAPSGAERESASDPEMQLIRFVREGGTDIVMTNWQAHPSGYASGTNGYVSAENWKIFREQVESDVEDTVCTFFLGAAGNLGYNITSALTSFTDPNGTTHTATNWTGKGQAMAGFATYALNNNMTTVEPGSLKVANYTYEMSDLYRADTYKNIDFDLNVVTIGGDIAFVTSPYEMFHENGSQIKAYAESLGFETCFVLTNSMGENKYMGAYNSFENDETDGKLTSFGVRTCRFVKGTGEKLIDQYADMLAGLAGVAAVDTIYETYTVKVVDSNGNAIENVMVQLVGGNNARNCTDSDGMIDFWIYGGLEYSIEIVKLPDGYTAAETTYSFDENNNLTITVTAE